MSNEDFIICPACDGLGFISIGMRGDFFDCDTCHGTGEIRIFKYLFSGPSDDEKHEEQEVTT